MNMSIASRSILAAAVVVACGTTSVLADAVIASGTASGAGIRALSAQSLVNSGNATSYNYGFGTTYQFRTVTGASDSLFTSARNAANASLLSGLPGGWNNPSNTSNGWSYDGNATLDGYANIMNAAGARWIGSPNNQSDGSGDSVLFAVPFYATSATTATITLTWASDNSFGSGSNAGPNAGANGGAPDPAGFTNRGVFLNGTDLNYAPPTANGQPNQWQRPTLLQQVFSVSLNQGVNWLYLHQFNSGGPGGSGFVANIQGAGVTLVPLPAPVWGGIAGLASVGGLVAIRRRRMA